MTNYIIHGDNIVASRQKLTQLLDKSREVIRLDGKKVDATGLKQSLESGSMFSQEKIVVLEHLNQKFIPILTTTNKCQVIIWEKKILSQPTLKKLKNFQALLFKTPKAVYGFLDSLSPQNPQPTLNIYHKQLQSTPSELTFYMLHRRISQLITAADKQTSHKLAGAPWQVNRLKTQANKFSLNSLIALQKQLSTIDYNVKTGKSILPLSSLIDLLIYDL
jgi:DNA polymerase III delta subunit